MPRWAPPPPKMAEDQGGDVKESESSTEAVKPAEQGVKVSDWLAAAAGATLGEVRGWVGQVCAEVLAQVKGARFAPKCAEFKSVSQNFSDNALLLLFSSPTSVGICSSSVRDVGYLYCWHSLRMSHPPSDKQALLRSTYARLPTITALPTSSQRADLKMEP